MRPTIDIPYKLHGELKDFAKEEGIELSEAYAVVLKRGLDEENDGGGGR